MVAQQRDDPNFPFRTMVRSLPGDGTASIPPGGPQVFGPAQTAQGDMPRNDAAEINKQIAYLMDQLEFITPLTADVLFKAKPADKKLDERLKHWE